MTIKNHFLINGVALNLALRQKLVETRKCPFLALKEPITEADPESYVSFANSSRKETKICRARWSLKDGGRPGLVPPQIHCGVISYHQLLV